MDEDTTAEKYSGSCSSFRYIYNGWSNFNNINDLTRLIQTKVNSDFRAFQILINTSIDL